MPAATQDLQRLAETDAQDLGFLLHLLEASERQSLAQVGAAPHGGPSPAPLQHLGSETPRPGALGSAELPVCLISPGHGVGWRFKREAPGSGQLKP